MYLNEISHYERQYRRKNVPDIPMFGGIKAEDAA